MPVALSLERLYTHGGYDDPTADGIVSTPQSEAQEDLHQDATNDKENDKQMANQQDQEDHPHGDDHGVHSQQQQQHPQEFPAGSYDDRRGYDQDKTHDDDYQDNQSPSSNDNGGYYSHYQQQQPQQYAPPHPLSAPMDRSQPQQQPYLTSLPQHFQYMAPPPSAGGHGGYTSNGPSNQYQQQPHKDLGNPAEEYVTDPLPFDYAGVPQASANGNDATVSSGPDDSRFYSSKQLSTATTRATLSYASGYNSPYNNQPNVGPTHDKHDVGTNQDKDQHQDDLVVNRSGYYQNVNVYSSHPNDRGSYGPPPHNGDYDQAASYVSTSGSMSMNNMQAFVSHTYSPAMVDAGVAVSSSMQPPPPSSSSSSSMLKKDSSSSPSNDSTYHSPPMEYNSLNSRAIESQDAVIKVKTPLKTKYWRNGRRNLQCFPSCKVYGDYSAIKLEDLKQHDFMWGKCRGSIITEVNLTSNYAFQDILLLGRVHSLESVPVAFEDAVIRECMIGRTVDCDSMDVMKENWITGEQLPTFVEQPPNVASYEFKPKVWKYMDDMAQGKCKRRNVRYYVQFEAFVLVMQGGQRCYLCIGSGMSTPFEVGSSRVLARQKRKAAANAEAAAVAANSMPQHQTMPPSEMSMASLHHSAMPMQPTSMPHGMLMAPHQMQPMQQPSLFNGGGYGGPAGPSPMGQPFPGPHRGLPSSFPNPLHSMGPPMHHHPPFSLGQADHLAPLPTGNVANSVGDKRKLGDENTFASYLQQDRAKLLKFELK